MKFGTPRMRLCAPPRVFCEKSLEVADLMGLDFFESDKESATVCKQMI